MAKFFNKVNSFEDLKVQYKALLKENHPDNGGDVAKMQEINVEYDALFSIWKNRHEVETGENISETAAGTRMQFYTQFGWEGSRHDRNRSLKEIAKIVRTYVKEKYPTYKFSVRTSYGSMCQKLHVDLQESPIEIYKTFEELSQEDKNNLIVCMKHHWLFTLTAWDDETLKTEFERIWKENGNLYKCLNEATQIVVNDVDAFVKSYNYEDWDGMIDYFDFDFYYFGCCRNNGIHVKIVPRTARISKKTNAPATKDTKKQKTPLQVEKKAGYTFNVSQDKDTRDDSILWVVRIAENLSHNEFIRINKAINLIGGYYSKFKHGFIFRFEPSEKLKEVA